MAGCGHCVGILAIRFFHIQKMPTIRVEFEVDEVLILKNQVPLELGQHHNCGMPGSLSFSDSEKEAWI